MKLIAVVCIVALLVVSSEARFRGKQQTFLAYFWSVATQRDLTITSRVRGNIFGSVRVCLSVCLSGFTQGTLYTTTTVYGVLVHQEGAICTTKA